MPDENDQSDVKPSSVAEGFAVFQIKNPSRTDDKFTLRIRLDATVDELRALISQTYEGRPPPSQQTLVYAGRVLNQSNTRIKDFLRQHPDSSDPAAPHSLHLVVRAPATPPPATPAPAPSPSSIPAPAASSFPSPLPPPQQPPASSNPPQSHASPAPSTTPPPGRNLPSTSTPAQHLPPPSSSAPAPSTSQPQQAPAGVPSPSPYFLVMNPIMAAAYQAAYTAALAAAANLHPDGSSLEGNQAGLPPGLQLPPFMPPFAPPFAYVYPNLQAGTSGVPMLNQYVTFPAMPAPYGMYPFGLHNSMPYGPMPQPAGPFQHNEGLAQRVPPGRGHTIVLHAQRVRGDRVVNRGIHVFRFRLNLRALLQLLVFVVLFYQHFTVFRFLVLAAGALIIWLTSSWAPLRRLITSLLHPRPHVVLPPGARPVAPGAGAPAPAANQQPAAPQAPAADAAAQQPAQQQQQGQGQAPQGQPEGAAAAMAQQRAPGLLREVMLLLVGFVTSLMPGWHFNPEDAAAVAAAQQALAQQNAQGEEEEQRQQQQQQQQPDPQHAHQD